MVAKTKVLLCDAERVEPIAAEASPIIEPLKVSARFAEKFKFHLLKFSYAEDEFARCDFVSE